MTDRPSPVLSGFYRVLRRDAGSHIALPLYREVGMVFVASDPPTEDAAIAIATDQFGPGEYRVCPAEDFDDQWSEA